MEASALKFAKRIMAGKAACAWSKWRHDCKVSRKAGKMLLNRQYGPPFRSWREETQVVLHERAMLKQAAMRLLARALSGGFRKWREVVDTEAERDLTLTLTLTLIIGVRGESQREGPNGFVIESSEDGSTGFLLQHLEI